MVRDIIKRLTGMTDKEIFEADIPTTSSVRDIFYPKGITPRQSVRVWAHKLVGPEDLNEKREQLRKNTPAALQLPK